MRYINKYNRHAEALDLNTKYLKSIYRKDIAHPEPSPAEPERSFKSFKRYKQNWKPLLMDEQVVNGASRCCYCMRKLDDSKGKSNIEHVIPKSLSGAEGQTQYAYYASLAPALHDHIIMADDFVSKSFTSVADIDNEPKMPHTTGLSNLVIACNGTRETFNSIGCCCNATHDKNKMMPIMLMDKADSDVAYDENGLIHIYCNDGTLDSIIEELNSDTFMEIRAIWYHLSKIGKDISNALTMPMKERIDWFKQAYSTTNFESLDEDVIKYSGCGEEDDSDTYWKLLLAYDWFYFYPGYAKQRTTA